MSQYRERINEILEYAKSKKVAERKKFMVEMLELYENTEAVEEICKNTEADKQGVINWSYILHIIHKFLLSETDRLATKDPQKRTVMTERQNICILVQKTFQRANSNKEPLLKCKDALPLILQILGTNIYEYYQDTYLNVLTSCILPYRIYKVNMLPQHWQDLLSICLKLYSRLSSYASKRAVLEALQTIVEYGCLHSNLHLYVKDLLLFLENVFDDVRKNEELLTEASYKITNRICLQIAVEHRSVLCCFSESVLPNIISLKSSQEKYKLLLFFIRLHHPKGACKSCDGAHANNWEKWYIILKNIYVMLLKDLKGEVLSRSFIRLASEVFRQVLKNDDIITERKVINDCDYAQMAKRRKLNTKVKNPIEMLLDKNKEEVWPTIQILTAMLKQYPETLKPIDFVTLLKILVNNFMLSCKNECIMENLYESAGVLLTNKKVYYTKDMKMLNVYWNQVWDILYRSLSINQTEISAHKLLQLFIINNKVPNPNTILKLYVTNVVKWSPISVRTLLIFCEHYPLPANMTEQNINVPSFSMDTNSVRICLIKWILNIPWQKVQTSITPSELCLLLIHTILTTTYQRVFELYEYDTRNDCDCLKNEWNTTAFQENVEQCYLLLKYKTNFSNGDKKGCTNSKATENQHILYTQDIASYLMRSLHDFLKENKGDSLHTIILKNSIVAKMISMMKELNVISEGIDDLPLVHSMKKCLTIVYSSLENLDLSKSKYSNLFHVTRALNMLYETSYDTDVAKIIVSSVTLDMLRHMFNLMNLEDSDIDYETENDYSSLQDRRRQSERGIAEKRQCDFCNKGIIRIQATKALALFCCINVGEKKHEYQIKLMSNLLKINVDDLSHTVDFRMAIIVLKSLSKYGKEELWENHNNIPLENLLTLYNKCSKDETAIRYILNVLPYFIDYALRYKYEVLQLLDIVFKFHVNWTERRHGVLVQMESIKCLTEVIQIVPSHIYDKCSERIDGILSDFDAFSFIVQLEIMNCVRGIISSRDVPFKWKNSLFLQIEKTVNNLIIDKEIMDELKIDRNEVVTASALLLLALIVFTNATFQCKALLIMLRFIVDRNVDIETIPKAINTTDTGMRYSNLIANNLSYLMSYWYNSSYSSQSFPWRLMECISEEEFNKTHINEIAFIKFQKLELSHVALFCKDVNISFERVIEDIFPQILCWLLYCINANNENGTKALARNVFVKLISNEDEFSGIRKFSLLFSNKFEETLTYLVERLHDEDNFEEMFDLRVQYGMADPPHYKEKEINVCIEYIEENFLNQGMAIQQVLACNCPSILQKILFRLSNNIHRKELQEFRIKAFHQYVYFCSLIIKKLKHDYFNSLSMFVIKDIGYSLLHIIKMYDNDLCNAACKYFFKFIKDILPERSEHVKEIMNFTVICLTPVAQRNNTPAALEVLRFLIIDQKELMSNAIMKLTSFPNVPIFQEIRTVHNHLKHKCGRSNNLEREIQHFLSANVDKEINFSIEDISHLRIQLSSRKEELRELYNRLETFRGFAEDCASSILHRLVYKLIQLTTCSEMNVSIEAVKCLGELGPNDLTSMILYFEKRHVKEFHDLPEILSYKIITVMVQLLFHSDVKLREISAKVLYIVLSSSWGQKLLNAKYMEHIKATLDDPQTRLPLSYIQPFIAKRNSKFNNIVLHDMKLRNIVNPSNTIWTVQSDDSYSSWIVTVTCNIAECFTGFYSEDLIPICALSTDICEIILPRICFLIIRTNECLTSSICNCIDKFFEYHFSDSSKAPSCDNRIVRCMLNIVNYIRMQASDNYLKLNYMYIARAAQYCSAFFTAILYAEMFCESLLKDHVFTTIPKIDYIYDLCPEYGKVIQSILRDSYTNIGDLDAIRGTGSSHLQDPSQRISHYSNTREWNNIMLTQDVELSFGNMMVLREMASGLHQSGLQFLLSNFISTITRNGEKMDDDIQYECAWRLSNWNIPETNQASCKSEITEQDYHFYHYQALKCFHERNEMGVQNSIRNARISVIKAFRNISLESSKAVYEKLMQLQLIQEIEDLHFTVPDGALNKWQQQDVTNFRDFNYIEPILTQRTIMLQINNTMRENEHVKNALFNTYLEISRIAADKENLPIATRALAVLAKQTDLPSSIQDRLLYQESLLAKFRNDLEVGRFLLRNLMNKDHLDESLRAQILRVYGDWMAETKSENPEAVIQKYYLKSIETSMSIDEKDADAIKNLHGTQVALAHFADNQFQQISTYMKSSQFENLKECVTYSYKGLNMQVDSDDRDIRCALILNQRQNTNDIAELQHIEKERNNYLILALKYYLMVLQQSEDYNLLMFRIIALWMDNRHQKEVNSLLRENLSKITSFKFIPLVPQLAPHMNNVFNDFSGMIYDIMHRCALEHPHHTLPVLLALKNLYDDCDYNINKKRKPAEPRVLGAQKLLNELSKSTISSILQEMDELSHALVTLANLATSSSKPGCVIKIPRNQKILNIKNFQQICVPTLTINVSSSKNYKNIVGITKYLESYETVGGVNTPKKLLCIGTDGIRRHQLVKGKDDLRQDAVMQQVFGVMNTLLKACKETKRRKLHIRTYKVVPLTQRSGILEWCDNTMPITSVLVGSNAAQGLHKKYYPNDYSADVCKEKIAAAGKLQTAKKLKVFLDCCEHMHPAMHHFFIEKYPSPETWFERRLAYTRSVATTSIAGYILGLGDRHLSNILIDQTSAEVIHIDFGIAFEQGKVLPVPETIPFRLTRNIEDGMGVSGIEGTMRHACEKTLTVLRDQSQIIITLLQVLLYDPLFKWTITPAKAHDIQSGGPSRLSESKQCSSSTNKTAERALLRIEQKLQGTEEGLASSVSGQVERLIQQARDPLNLCRLYCGWQPYL